MIQTKHSTHNRHRRPRKERPACRTTAKTLLAIAVLLLASCASLGQHAEKPTVTLKSFRSVASDGGLPSFEIGLGVINPNREALNLYGVVYTVRLQGQELVKGVGKDFPPVEGYSEATIILRAQPNLLAGIRMLTGMLTQPAESLEYEFEARLDTGGWSLPIRVQDVGQFDLNNLGGSP